MEAWECIAGELPPGAARGRGRYCEYFGHETLTALESVLEEMETTVRFLPCK